MVNLSQINNITSIEELSEHYDLIRKYAHQLNPRMKEQLDDVLQDTFLKLSDIFLKYPGKVIDGGYVAMTLSSVYKNYLKSYNNKLNFGNETYEAIIQDLPDNYEEVLQEKLAIEDRYDLYEKKKSQLSWYNAKVLEYSLVMSVSELSRQSKISYKSLSWTLNKIKEKLKDAENNK